MMTDLSAIQKQHAVAGPRPVKSPRGTQISCKNWLIEAAYRMLQNNLDPEVAENPDASRSANRREQQLTQIVRQPIPVRRRIAGRVPLTRDGLAQMGGASRVAGEQAVPIIDKSRLRARMAKISEDANRLSVH